MTFDGCPTFTQVSDSWVIHMDGGAGGYVPGLLTKYLEKFVEDLSNSYYVNYFRCLCCLFWKELQRNNHQVSIGTLAIRRDLVFRYVHRCTPVYLYN